MTINISKEFRINTFLSSKYNKKNNIVNCIISDAYSDLIFLSIVSIEHTNVNYVFFMPYSLTCRLSIFLSYRCIFLNSPPVVSYQDILPKSSFRKRNVKIKQEYFICFYLMTFSYPKLGCWPHFILDCLFFAGKQAKKPSASSFFSCQSAIKA